MRARSKKQHLIGGHSMGSDFGELIKKIRKEKKMTQEKLSELSGVGMNSISGIETGQRNITEQMMKRIADTLGVELIFTLKEK